MSESNSKSDSSSSGMNMSSSRQKIWKGQQGALQDLYRRGSQFMNQYNQDNLNKQYDSSNQFNQNLANSAMPEWQKQMQGGAFQGMDQKVGNNLASSLQSSLNNPSNTGRMYSDIVGGEGNSYIDPLIARMRADSNTNLNRSLPGLDEQAISAGQMGSSRQGIAEGLARGEANRQLMTQEAQARAGAYDTDMNWKMKIAQAADQGIGQAQDRSMQLLNSQQGVSQQALSGGQQMMGYGAANVGNEQGRNQSPWDALGQYAGIIGGPIKLTNGTSFGNSSGSSSQKGQSSSMKS